MEPTENSEADNKVISLFPLPSTVLFPQTLLPLHIFEPRYREMVRASLEDKRWIGMVLLQPGWEDSYFENPPVEMTGGAGEIHQWDRRRAAQEERSYASEPGSSSPVASNVS